MALGRTRSVLVLLDMSHLVRRSVLPASMLVSRRTLTNESHDLEEIKAKRGKPWPFKRYPTLAHMFDLTMKRFNENTKIINVLGPMKVGKHDLAQQLAEIFDMKYFQAPTFDEIYWRPTGFDKRELNEQLSPHMKYIDLEAFYAEADPANLPGMARAEIRLYAESYFRWLDALSHLLNTGQGCVIVGGPYQESAYGEILQKMNYFTKDGYKYYKECVKNSRCMLLRPHLIIHLDAPISYIREQIKKRNDPKEVNSPVLTDSYIEAVRNNIRKQVDIHRKSCEVLKYDARQIDIDVISEKMTTLKLDPDITQRPKFSDWYFPCPSEDLSSYRTFVMSPKSSRAPLWNTPHPLSPNSNVSYRGDDFEEYQRVVLSHPMIKNIKGRVPKDEIMPHDWRP